VFLTGAYRKPREINWLIGLGLLSLTLAAGFVGYGLPWDAFAVTATGIGYALARSIPLGGPFISDLAFGGTFPTLGTLPRLYTLHVVVLPLAIAGLLGLHLLVILKQKHTQPAYARRLTAPDRVLGVPLWPQQALMAGGLLFLMLGGLSLLGAFVPVHPLAAYGPPTPETPVVKPDWYLLPIFGWLKLIPASASLRLGPLTIGPEFLGGVLLPGVALGVALLAPWLDRTNHQPVDCFEYLESPARAPRRAAAATLALGLLVIGYLGAYYDQVGIPLPVMWALALGAPAGAALSVERLLRGRSS
jgi:cytochrome b-561